HSMFARLPRHREQEIMDQPGLDPRRHCAALSALGRINFVSASAGIVWPPLRRLAQKLGRTVRILDIASGGGDVPIRLSKRATRSGARLEIEGCDISPTAVDFARRRARAAGT